jgi:hypothetical protein
MPGIMSEGSAVISALRENLTTPPFFKPPALSAEPSETRRWSPPCAWQCGELPFRLNYSPEHGQ